MRRIKFGARAGDIANAPTHVEVWEVEDDTTDEQLLEMAIEHMWETVRPEHWWEDTDEPITA